MGYWAGGLSPSALYADLNTGQIISFALLALVLCGVTISRRKYWLAGILAVFSAIQPIAGVPVILATFLFVPRTRPAVILTGSLFAVLAAGLVGQQGLLQYVTAVLPAQAASEVQFPFQYSLTYGLAFFGAPAPLALAAGTISYCALLVTALWLSPRVSQQLGKPELLVFIPALCAVIGGTYLHPEELCLALPALLELALSARGTREPPSHYRFVR